MGWQTILVPHDFSTSADRAAAIARDEAMVHRGRVVLLHVVEPPHDLAFDAMIVPESVGPPISVRDYAIANAEAHLDEIVERFAADGVVATRVVKFGVPVDEINRCVEEEHADVVVMGTHGRSGIRHLIAGSVAERVVRTSQVPVLTVGQRA